MVSSVFPRPWRDGERRCTTHFVGENAVQPQLVLVEEPVQGGDLVVAHGALDARGLGLEMNHVDLDVLTHEQIILLAVVYAHTPSTLKEANENDLPRAVGNDAFFGLASKKCENTVPC